MQPDPTGAALRHETPSPPTPEQRGATAVLRWIAWLVPLALATGTAVALFLWLLDEVTARRVATPWLLWFLPVAGAIVAVLYDRAGRGVERGSNLILDEIHTPGGGVPGRLAPLVLFGTILTHLYGGSAGREGTAVQMGGSIAGAWDRHVLPRLGQRHALAISERRVFLQAGMAAGFSAVFGTPFAGALFAIEVLRVGRLAHSALLPCVVAALLADLVTRAWGIQHTAYPTVSAAVALISPALVAQVAVAAIMFGLASRLFSLTTHGVSQALGRLVRLAWLRPVVGGLAVIVLVETLGTRDYLGLGVSSPDANAVTILSAFRDGGAERWSWLLKLVFTVITIGSGFKGGEVTPLFFIGATLGNTLALWLGAPVELFAALGFVAVFAGATNTPLACTVMAVELFGLGALPFFAVACGLAFAVSGPTGVYTAQRRRDTSVPAIEPPPQL
jgi:H+/Cl- antiporter ClcA